MDNGLDFSFCFLFKYVSKDQRQRKLRSTDPGKASDQQWIFKYKWENVRLMKYILPIYYYCIHYYTFFIIIIIFIIIYYVLLFIWNNIYSSHCLISLAFLSFSDFFLSFFSAPTPPGKFARHFKPTLTTLISFIDWQLDFIYNLLDLSSQNWEKNFIWVCNDR